MSTDYKLEGNGNQLRVFMPKELDHHVAAGMCSELDQLIDSYQVRRIVFDFGNTDFMDSSGIGVIIGRSRKLHYLGGMTCAVHLCGQIQKIFLASGLGEIVQVVDQEKENEEDNIHREGDHGRK